MRLSIIKADQLPLGKRVLKYGYSGQDVTELQKLLRQASFYFGEQDGTFGMLTEEAVTSLQQTFHLKADGVAGGQVFNLLNKIAGKKGRIIYTVKNNEQLGNISQRFAVKKSAWRRIPGQGNPHKRIYPGLKILLHEKAFFCWDVSENKTSPFSITGLLSNDFQIDCTGELKRLTKDTTVQNGYHLVGADRDVWLEILSSKKIWVRLVAELKKIGTTKFGFDLREAPVDKIIRWSGFLKFICKSLELKELKFLVLPFLPVDRRFENQLYWLNLPIIFTLAKYIMVEPVYHMETPLLFESSAVCILKDLRGLVDLGLSGKSILICQAVGWDWNIDQNRYEKFPYKVAKLIHAGYARITQYSPQSKFSTLYYLKRNEHHCLVYRDETGWMDFLAKIIELNLAGIGIRNFKDLGNIGPELIAGSFKVVPEESFWS